MAKLKVAVLRGGPSHEYEVSLKTGHNVLSLLRENPDSYDPVDVFISKDGAWHHNGIADDPHKILRRADVAWNALHGSYGEDGQVQHLLESLKVPFTGSGALASALSMNKEAAKKIYRKHGLLTPQHEVLREDFGHDHLVHVFRNYLHPVIVKPISSGSSVGVRLARTFQELEEAVRHALNYSNKVLIEEFIRGKEGSCGVVEGFRDEKLYALLPIEIRKPRGEDIFGYGSKYSEGVKEICPGNFRSEESEAISEMAKQAHRALGLRHYSRSDFIITPKGKVYILETNSLPGFTQESLLPKSLGATGWHPKGFVDHILELALKR